MKRMIVVLAVAAIALGGCEPLKDKKSQGDAQAPAKTPTAVEAILVSKSTVSREILASGTAAGIREVHVVSETQGTIQSVGFNLGQAAAKGHVLVEVDNTLQKAGLEQAQHSAAVAELNIAVTRKLFDEGNASEAEFIYAQAAASGAHAALESARKALSDCRITAPISGYIAQKEPIIEGGNYLVPGSPITRIVDISSLKATVAVGEGEIGLLRNGMKAEIRVCAVSDKGFSGTVAAVGAGSDPATGSYPVEIVWSNTPGRDIKSGMSVQVTIQTQSMDSAIMIPSRSVVESDRKDAVFVAVNGKAASRYVSLGRTAGVMIEITNGLRQGEVLVTSGMTTLARGDSLIVSIAGKNGSIE